MSRELTKDEVRERFLDYLAELSQYWNNVEDRTQQERLDGLVFSILSTLDGCSAELPGFLVAPLPHEDDKEFRRAHYDDWYPENHQIEEQVNCDIAGGLHEQYHKAVERTRSN